MGVAEPTGLDLFVVFISNEGNKVNNNRLFFIASHFNENSDKKNLVSGLISHPNNFKALEVNM